MGRTCCGVKGIDALLRLGHSPDRRTSWFLETETQALWDGPRFHIATNSFTEWTTYFYGSQDRGIHRWLRKHARRDWVCVDAGMNFGFFTCLCAQLCQEIHGFEPVISLVERARRNCELNQLKNVFLNPAVLTDTPGTARFHMYREDSCNLGTGSLVHGHQGRVVTVPATTLDAYCAKVRLTGLNFIKIDVEGAEHLVLRGASSCLERFRSTIIFEWNHDSCEEVVRFLRSLNYQFRTLEGRELDLGQSRLNDGTNVLAVPDH